MSDDYVLKPSIRRWRDHSAGISLSRTTPIPCGSRPSMAAFARSGARKANEIVMLTLRTLHPSRSAMLSVLAAGSVVSSSSHRRPRAIDATRSARFSERIGRMFCDASDSGTRISRRRVDGILRHGTSIASRRFRFRFDPTPIASVSSMMPAKPRGQIGSEESGRLQYVLHSLERGWGRSGQLAGADVNGGIVRELWSFGDLVHALGNRRVGTGLALPGDRFQLFCSAGRRHSLFHWRITPSVDDAAWQSADSALDENSDTVSNEAVVLLRG